MSKHDAVDSALGYAHQILTALVLLLKADDDESVSVELTDDVTIHHTPSIEEEQRESRYQISHTMKGEPAALTIKSVKLWKTLAIWASQFNRRERYLLLTCAPVSGELNCLSSTGNRAALETCLVDEANLVVAEADSKEHAHAERIAGCREFLKLNAADRGSLLNQILILDQSPNITLIDQQIDHFFRSILRPYKRAILVKRVREYWLNRVYTSLTGESSRIIPKGEIQDFIEEAASAISGGFLPDDFGSLEPPSDLEAPNIMRRQVEIVKGGKSRLARARVAHWRSRNQRDRWMVEDISFRNALDTFDRKLIDAWRDRHGPMSDDVSEAIERDKQTRGCALLDWSHLEAPAMPFNYPQVEYRG
jgi:hypothetical protein